MLKENTKSIEDFKDIHKDKRCFVVGNGPSLSTIPMEKLDKEITIGCNRIYLHKTFTPTYYTIEDKRVGAQIESEIANYTGTIKLIPHDMLFSLESSDIIRFKLHSGRGVPFCFVSKEHSIFCWGGTVTYVMIQLAYYLGCNPIYLLGVDNSYKNLKGGLYPEGDYDHFDSTYFKDVVCNAPHPERMEIAYQHAEAYSKHLGFKIYNANKESQVKAFEKCDLLI